MDRVSKTFCNSRDELRLKISENDINKQLEVQLLKLVLFQLSEEEQSLVQHVLHWDCLL